MCKTDFGWSLTLSLPYVWCSPDDVSDTMLDERAHTPAMSLWKYLQNGDIINMKEGFEIWFIWLLEIEKHKLELKRLMPPRAGKTKGGCVSKFSFRDLAIEHNQQCALTATPLPPSQIVTLMHCIHQPENQNYTLKQANICSNLVVCFFTPLFFCDQNTWAAGIIFLSDRNWMHS